jgi:two-component system, OmpR family, sensor histidine kinase CreC
LSKRNRIFIGLLLIYVAGIAFLLYRQLGDLDPRYRESAEESLVETAHLMASLIEQDAQTGAIDVQRLGPVFKAVYARSFEADIFGIKKTRVELRCYVTDAQGIVLFDSLGKDAGQDYSGWRDVRLTLDGKYGARSTRDVEEDPASSVMYVAAPVRAQGRLVGVVSVGKPVQSFGQFVQAARQKTLSIGLLSAGAVLLLGLMVSVWLVRPFGLIADYVRFVREQRSLSLPRLGRRAWGAIGAAYDEMRDALAGRNYVADYVQTLTHEVKSPLSAIRGAAELLHEPMPEAQRQRFLDNITRETARIQEMVDRMMELTALETRRSLGPTELLSINALLQEAATSAQARASARGITVAVAAPDDAQKDVQKDAQVLGERFLLRQALGNLLDNAIDFSPSNARIDISVTLRPRTIAIAVADQGPGIPEYAQDKVFEKFYSLARPHTQKKSTGLGLAFVKEIASLHQGRIELHNRPAHEGTGAIATLQLPRHVR